MKVSYIPNQPHCYAFGGFEIQMLAAFQAVKKLDVDTELFDLWKRNADFDIAHVWGFETTQAHHILYAHKAKKKVVVTALLQNFSSLETRLRFYLSSYIYKARILKELINYVDKFTTVNHLEKQYLIKYFAFPAERIEVIPNIVGETYLNDNETNSDFLGISDFILCVGNICQRKNQLNLVRAANEIGMPILLMGNAIEGESGYADQVNLELRKNPLSKWMSGVKENTLVIKAAFQSCKAFALISHHENQPISVLEALSLGCKVLLADKPYAYQLFFEKVGRANPNNIESIRDALIKLLSAQTQTVNEVKEKCTEQNVGKRYKNVYESLMN
jgi:glycosyltransferase involved in cell wall biosynthesis